MEYFIAKFLHIIGAAVLLGTGAGIAFFMLVAHRTGDAKVIAGVARISAHPTVVHSRSNCTAATGRSRRDVNRWC